MELTILNSILHGSLKPWRIDTTNIKRFTELAKSAKVANTATLAELHSQLLGLLADHPNHQKTLSQLSLDATPLQSLLYETSLPQYNDGVSYFYHTLITGEINRVYNAFLLESADWELLIDEQYQLNKILTSLKVLIKQVYNELQEGNYSEKPTSKSDSTHFALYYLKNSLVQLFFSIQQYFLDTVPQAISEDDFYILELEDPEAERVVLTLNPKMPARPGKDKKDKFSFGFKGDVSTLKKVIRQLTMQVDLLNDEPQSEEQLLQLLTATDIQSGATKIGLGCGTAVFAQVAEQLKKHFYNLTEATIAKSESFFSKKGNLIKAQNLYSSKATTHESTETIAEIINQLK